MGQLYKKLTKQSIIKKQILQPLRWSTDGDASKWLDRILNDEDEKRMSVKENTFAHIEEKMLEFYGHVTIIAPDSGYSNN